MNNDGEDVRELLCVLCRCNKAEEGERLCAACIEANAAEPPPLKKIDPERFYGRASPAPYWPQRNPDHGHWE